MFRKVYAATSFGKKIFNEQAVSEDVNRINQYYLKNGLQGSVVQIRKDFFNRNENVNLTYCIEECAEENRINDLTEAGVDQNHFEKKEMFQILYGFLNENYG